MKKRFLSVALALSLAGIFSIPASANANNGQPLLDEKAKVIEKFNSLSQGKLNINLHNNKGLQFSVSGKLSDKISVTPESVTNYLEQNKSLFGLKNSGNFTVKKVEKDELGHTNFRVTQTIKGIPVYGQDLIVHVDKDGIVKSISGTVINDITDISYIKSGKITDKQAIDIAKSQFSFSKLKNNPTVEKTVLIKDGKAYEAYKVNVYYTEPEIGNWDVFVEASSGDVLDKLSKIRYDGAVSGTGVAVDGSTKTINLYQQGSSYELIDKTKAMTGDIETYTANNSDNTPGTLVTTNTTKLTTEAQKAEVSAHYNAGVVYDFYKNIFGRNSIDGNGMSILSTAHYDSSYNNAYWDGTQMVYGDGDGSEFTYLSGDLGVVGHELTHGVTQYTADLTYSNQSGALNESMSDVFGVLVKTYDKYDVKDGGTWTFSSSDWVIGEAVYTPSVSGDALRSLANPTLYDQPDNMSNYVSTSSDNGGVHTNSGITNKAAYLVAQAIGNTETAKIYYRALTTYLTASSDFVAARNALVNAATDLYGASSTEVSAINSAFTSVGVGGSTGSGDLYEPNDATAQAYAITSGTTYSSYIYTSSDVDYYKLTSTKGKAISISLTNLPKDYDLYLYNSSGTQVAKSINGGTTSESISYTPSASSTYYIKVIGYNGYYSTSVKYSLKATF
ncbi:M4 family metallopeptidase [Clostridium sp. 19966]|uniref:M4 family metallopeptidase n=1 Tax=Clostridium sp. 19966 TaxID=2768166 RepID=UPI0028DFA462|nr:M4 family metallopeptidase [Clostridium sp. 19966]MDT8718892.1 M4 family metallopeptidase [Clostridium sp. 19966]